MSDADSDESYEATHRWDVMLRGRALTAETEVARLRVLASRWQEIVSAPSFEAAVTIAANAYHETECVYAIELKRLREGIAPEPIDPVNEWESGDVK